MRETIMSACLILILFQVMETTKMIYLVTEFASGGEVYGQYILMLVRVVFGWFP